MAEITWLPGGQPEIKPSGPRYPEKRSDVATLGYPAAVAVSTQRLGRPPIGWWLGGTGRTFRAGIAEGKGDVVLRVRPVLRGEELISNFNRGL